MKYVRAFIVIFFISLLLSAMVQGQWQSQNRGYLYVSLATDNINAILQIVNPITLEEIDVVTLSLPAGYIYTDTVSLSPDGRWLIYQLEHLNESRQHQIILLEISSGITREIPLPVLSRTDSRLITWHSDSQQVAFAVIPIDGNDETNGPFIYNIGSHQIASVSGSHELISSPLWSHDQLLLGSGVTIQGDSFIEIYDSVTNRMVEKYYLPNIPYRLVRSCNHIWSPNNLRIAFGSSCQGLELTIGVGGGFGSIKELHVLDRENNTVITLTDYTTTLKQQGLTYIDASFRPYWINDNLLAFGVVYSNQLNNTVWEGETVLYNFSTNKSSLLSNENLGDWTPNPIYEDLAFTSGIDFSVSDRNIRIPSVHIGYFDMQTSALAVHTSLSSGCNLSWSPDGDVLASVELSNVFTCRGTITSISFWDRSTLVTQVYSIPTDENNIRYRIPLGWVYFPPPT